MSLWRRLVESLRRTIAPPFFVVEIRDRTARAAGGQVPPGLLAGFSDVARDLELTDGKIYGVRRPQGISLAFSREIPEAAHQRLRNVLVTQRNRIPGG